MLPENVILPPGIPFLENHLNYFGLHIYMAINCTDLHK